MGIVNGHTCALTTADIVSCWGDNFNGELGSNIVTSSSVPLTVSGLDPVASISTGSSHSCALTKTDKVLCWGINTANFSDNGSTTNAITPTTMIEINGKVKSISSGGAHDCVVIVTGTLQCWGGNYFGQLGNGTYVSSNNPVTVTGISGTILAVAAGMYHTCALTDSGEVFCWGDNYAGQLGTGLIRGMRNSPVAVSGLSAGVSAIAVGEYYTCALTNAGAVMCWGANDFGQLGIGSVSEFESTPMMVIGLDHGVTAIAAGGRHTCAIMLSGALKCWGANDFGQLGNGATWKETPQRVIGFSEAPPLPIGDSFESDDNCGQATYLTANVATQTHTFDKVDDTDWIRIETLTGTNYTLVVSNLMGGALPGFSLRNSCVAEPVASSPPSFGGEVRLPISARDYSPGTYYIKISNVPTTTFGNTVSYTLSFRATSGASAAIIVAGKNDGAVYQNVISQTTDLAYLVLLRNGLSRDRILYLDDHSRDVDGNGLLDDIDGPATVPELQSAITVWARDKVSPAQPLWLFMADHGFPEQFLVSGNSANDIVSPIMLDNWLSQLEADTGVSQINVVIDACYSGSFVTQPQSISKHGRAVLTSTSADRVAQGKPVGLGNIQRMYFSEALWSALDANLSLLDAFQQARAAASIATQQDQQAWLDDNGDGNPNTVSDGENVSQRGLIGLTMASGRPYLTWQTVNTTSGVILVRAQAINSVDQVLVEVIRPDTIQTPIVGEINLAQHEYVALHLVSDSQWVGTYARFNKEGTYRLIGYASSVDGSPANPSEFVVQVGDLTVEPPTPTPSVTISVTPSNTPTPQPSTVTATPGGTTTVTPTPTSPNRRYVYLPLAQQ